MDFRIAVVQPITLRRRIRRTLPIRLISCTCSSSTSASSTREIYATTNTITSLQAAKQGVLGQQRLRRGREAMYPRTRE